jgi:hypothetical protein
MINNLDRTLRTVRETCPLVLDAFAHSLHSGSGNWDLTLSAFEREDIAPLPEFKPVFLEELLTHRWIDSARQHDHAAWPDILIPEDIVFTGIAVDAGTKEKNLEILRTCGLTPATPSQAAGAWAAWMKHRAENRTAHPDEQPAILRPFVGWNGARGQAGVIEPKFPSQEDSLHRIRSPWQHNDIWDRYWFVGVMPVPNQ